MPILEGLITAVGVAVGKKAIEVLFNDEERIREERIDKIKNLLLIISYISGIIVLYFLGDLSIIWNFWSGWWLTLIIPVSIIVTGFSIGFIVGLIDRIIGGIEEISAFFVPLITSAIVFAAVHYLVHWLLV